MMTDLQNYITALDVFTRIKSFQNELFNSKNLLKKETVSKYLSFFCYYVQ